MHPQPPHPRDRRFTKLIGLLCALLLLPGCTSITAEQSGVLKSAFDLYTTPTRDMHRDDFIATLGAPQKVDGATLTWETAITPRNYESLTVEFDSAGVVTTMIQTSHRFSRGPLWAGGRHIERTR